MSEERHTDEEEGAGGERSGQQAYRPAPSVRSGPVAPRRRAAGEDGDANGGEAGGHDDESEQADHEGGRREDETTGGETETGRESERRGRRRDRHRAGEVDRPRRWYGFEHLPEPRSRRRGREERRRR